MNEDYTSPSAYEHARPLSEQAYQPPVYAPPPPLYTPPPPDYSPMSPPGYQYQYYAPLASHGQERRPERTVGGLILCAVFYLWAVLCFAFGIAATMIHSLSNQIVGLTFLFVFLLGLISLVLLLVFRKRLFLRWWVRLLIEVGLLVLTIVAFIGAIGIQQLLYHYSTDSYQVYVTMGCIFAVYGVLAGFAAFW